MKRKRIYFVLWIVAFAAMASLQDATAQKNYAQQIVIENQQFVKKGRMVHIDMDVNLNNLKIDKNDMLIVTPVIIGTNSSNEVALESFAVKGTLRNKILNRPFARKGKANLTMAQDKQLVRRNGSAQTLHYSATLPFSEWLRQAQLIVKTEVVGCADCTAAQPDKLISDKILPDKFVPDYRMAYIVPEVEEVKQRSERYSAYLNYPVGRHNLLPNFENNAQELAKVDKIINELKSDKNLTISDFTVSGYASPEGSKASNLTLSQRRAETFARYIEKKYGYTRSQVKVEWFGEDWDGLRKAVMASALRNKDDIVAIIDKEPDFDARDAQLIALDNSETYNRLLKEFYPPLRRNDYNIAFISRAFDVDEAKQMIKIKPKLLSLNEMYLVANTYDENSPQYKEVFDIAANTFPDAEVACINAAVGELRANNPDAALRHLKRCPDTAPTVNLKGVAYAQKGDTNRARDYFERAAKSGNADATHNMQQLQLYVDDNL